VPPGAVIEYVAVTVLPGPLLLTKLADALKPFGPDTDKSPAPSVVRSTSV
jgi:hypothetical protein